MKNTNIYNEENESGSQSIILCAILSYNNPLHHPAATGSVVWASMNSKDHPINYRSEVEPSEDQRIRNQGNSAIDPEKKEEVKKPSKDDENISVPNTEEGDPAEDLPDSEDPNVAKDDVEDL
ncbi:hypothetical protein ACFSQ3_12040 [Sphingobacterium corticis]|uniref:Uncharacterized protein n=1 Tax=Sphingobacterium corticis TaxID=1812823 RepID=A0ABW5NLS3_9SPHI